MVLYYLSYNKLNEYIDTFCKKIDNILFENKEIYFVDCEFKNFYFILLDNLKEFIVDDNIYNNICENIAIHLFNAIDISLDLIPKNDDDYDFCYNFSIKFIKKYIHKILLEDNLYDIRFLCSKCYLYKICCDDNICDECK